MKSNENNGNAEFFINSVGSKLKFFRKKQGISQTQLAYEAQIPREQVGRIERGEINTTLRTLFNLAKALDVEVKDFFSEE